MMTIREFASLCGCSTQTLRYYDRIDLLKPVRVDPDSGYRYYAKSQAIDFVKIKNLQAADFSISEIKQLLAMPDALVYEAFDRKIVEQVRKLERIKEIQQSYLTEKNNMEKLIQSAADYLFHALSDYSILQEFGMSPDEGPAVVARLRDFYERTTLRHLPAAPEVQLILNGSVIRGAKQIAEAFASLKGTGYEDTVLLGDADVDSSEDLTPDSGTVLWEANGWNYVHEFLHDIPKLEIGYEYCFFFRLTEEKYSEGLEFPLFMIAAMLPQLDFEDISCGCSVVRSSNGQNQFALLRK